MKFETNLVDARNEIRRMELTDAKRAELNALLDEAVERHHAIQENARQGRRAATRLGEAISKMEAAMRALSGVVADASLALKYRQFDAEARVREEQEG